MECTQRIECTQQEFLTQTKRECTEQIGFLGICGNKYPVNKGPNKIGRDPQTCNIVLNLNSVSRQHAVINVLSKKEFMLMDLDSANKTKCLGKNLMPYVPQPLKNGDMVQFGEVFGIFRLIEEEDDLPMTQAINIPDTPIPDRHRSKLYSATTVPESPDVSDKDDSFIIASQPKGNEFKSSGTHHFIKPGKTISIQPIGGNKIDNIYWNSSKKSTSLNLDDSNTSFNDSIPFAKLSEKENEVNASNIHEMDTQAFHPKVKETDAIYEANTQLPESLIPSSIYSANTQVPGLSTSSLSIYTANTQLPGSSNASPSIYTANTELPEASHSPPSIHSQNTQPPSAENLPDVRKINEQQDMQFDLYADKDIYNADTQIVPPASPTRAKSNRSSSSNRKSNEISKLDRSDDVVLFGEIDSQVEEENLVSQAILTEDILLPINKCVATESEPLSQIAFPKSSKRNMRIKSDSSTDCDEIDDDILPSQKDPEKERKANDGDTTDCEDEMIELKTDKKLNNTVEVLDLEDVATQVIDVLETPPAENFEDMLTQVIVVDEKIDVLDVNDTKEKDFENLPTQVIVDNVEPTEKPLNTELISDEVEISPFKIPLKIAIKTKKKDVSNTLKIKVSANKHPVNYEDNKYYQDTQDIFKDLCSQKASSPEVPILPKKLSGDMSQSNSDVEDKINNFISTLSSQDVRDVIGAATNVDQKVTSLGSDSSDLEVTPKKMQPVKFMDIDLPNSQEIKTSVSHCFKSMATESSSESETEQDSKDQCTPILFHMKKKQKHVAKMDLTKRFDVEALPTRVITRVRKPTLKIQNVEGRKMKESILKPKFLTEQDDDVDTEIITENITRLKSNNIKSKDAGKVNRLDQTKNLAKEKIPDGQKNITKESSHVDFKEDSYNDGKKLNSCDVKKQSSHDVKKESKPRLNMEAKESKKAKHMSEKICQEETVKKRESKRKKKSSSPVKEINKDVVDHIDVTEKPNDIQKIVETVELYKNKTTDPKRNASTLSSQINEEKPLRPIIIEPHTIIVPMKKEKKKREPRRKNKELTTNANKFENHDFSIETHSNDSEPVRVTRGRTKISEGFIDTEADTKKIEKPKRKEPSPEKEVRRSTRQRTVKEKEPEVKSILKKSTLIHDQSTIYNLSSGSNSDFSSNLKRSADFEELAPISKRKRMAVNVTLRETPSRMQKTCYVLFTAFPHEEVKMKLEKLGAIIVSDVMQCTVLLTLQIRRTFKLLCAVSLGKPIVGPNWVQACADTNMIVDPWLFIIKDDAVEKRFHFNLQRTLTGQRNFLKGYNLSSTPNVQPQASEMKLIVQCSGGAWREGGARWLCLTCAADRALWPGLRARGATLVSTELILSGVLRQILDIPANAVKI